MVLFWYFLVPIGWYFWNLSEEPQHPMSVHKTSTGTWRARVRDHAGKQLTKTFKLKSDAQAWERKQLAARDSGELMSSGKMTVAEFSKLWLASARDLAPNTILTYRKSLGYILPVLGGVQLQKLTPEMIDAFIDEETESGLAASTVHRHYRTLNRLCNVAMQRKRLTVNPCTHVRPPKVGKSQMQFLTVDQVEALAANIAPRYRAFILLGAYGGLRWGELRALKPEHFDGRAVTVVEQLGGADVKTQASRRRIELPAGVAAELTAHIDRYPGRYIFTNMAGNALHHSSFTSQQYKKALVKAGIDRETTIHALRHTCASLMIAAGAHPKMVSEYLGHSGIAVTMNKYSHLFPVMHAQAADDLDRFRNEHMELDDEGDDSV
jgi:integrase